MSEAGYPLTNDEVFHLYDEYGDNPGPDPWFPTRAELARRLLLNRMYGIPLTDLGPIFGYPLPREGSQGSPSRTT